MTDLYVIVYRDGKQSALISKDLADNAMPTLTGHPLVSKRPAYRIRVREKCPKAQLAQQAQTWGLYDDPPGPRA